MEKKMTVNEKEYEISCPRRGCRQNHGERSATGWCESEFEDITGKGFLISRLRRKRE